METTFRPLSRKQAEELRSYVGWVPAFFRPMLFFAFVGMVAWLLRAFLARLARNFPLFGHDAWWAVPSLALAAALYFKAADWTGGRSFRSKVRHDLKRGMASVRKVGAIDAIEVDEREDEGHAYFVLTEDGKTVLFAGQYLEKYRRKGFPWKAFEIVEAPESGVFFDLVAAAESLVPSFRRPPFTWEERKRFGGINDNYVILDTDFESLKKVATSE